LRCVVQGNPAVAAAGSEILLDLLAAAGEAISREKSRPVPAAHARWMLGKMGELVQARVMALPRQEDWEVRP
jgi:hypothetical protein